DKDEALEASRRPMKRSQIKEFDDKLNWLYREIQRYLVEEKNSRTRELNCPNAIIIWWPNLKSRRRTIGGQNSDLKSSKVLPKQPKISIKGRHFQTLSGAEKNNQIKPK
ncbi:hypothetical protein HAX54_043668, partial [Datura stramonium]|nr:hypothetical protein [Datura stramonium]